MTLTSNVYLITIKKLNTCLHHAKIAFGSDAQNKSYQLFLERLLAHCRPLLSPRENKVAIRGSHEI